MPERSISSPATGFQPSVWHASGPASKPTALPSATWFMSQSWLMHRSATPNPKPQTLKRISLLCRSPSCSSGAAQRSGAARPGQQAGGARQADPHQPARGSPAGGAGRHPVPGTGTWEWVVLGWGVGLGGPLCVFRGKRKVGIGAATVEPLMRLAALCNVLQLRARGIRVGLAGV